MTKLLFQKTHTQSRTRFSEIAQSIFNLVYPPVCCNCKKTGALFCNSCRSQLSFVRPPLCEVCGLSVSASAKRCRRCQRVADSSCQIRAAVFYTGSIKRAIYTLKYQNRFGLAKPLAEIMFEAWPQWRVAADVVVPIPLHAERFKERGFNQSAVLGRSLARQLQLPFDAKMLVRHRSTASQVTLQNRAERIVNVQGAFSVPTVALKNSHILLIDDVCTSGATLFAAADALLAAGAKKVSAYCLARAIEHT